MSDFQLRHHNRRHFPKKYIAVVEDDLENQLRFAAWAAARFDGQGNIQFDFISSTIAMALILHQVHPHMIILDHDLPYGNASDLLAWMHRKGVKDVPIITASGIPQNNEHIVRLCKDYGIECHHFQKPQVFFGDADNVVKMLLARDRPLLGNRPSDMKGSLVEPA